jgi:predicted Zn-dependent peptidase
MTDLIEVVGAEMRRMAEEGPSAAEVARAKAQLKAGLLMSLESSSARAEQMARYLLNFDRLIPSEELVQRVEDVTPEAVRLVAGRLAAARPSVAVVGAGTMSPGFAAHAERVLAA